MKKISILIAYPEMMVGGSTTSLLAFLNCIDKEKYEVDLQLYKNRGPLMSEIPSGIRLLPEAFTCGGRLGGIAKKIRFLLSGAIFKARRENQRIGKSGFSGQVMADFQARYLSRKANEHYDITIGFMEGWADRYIAYCVMADKKMGWIHNTFANIAEIPRLEADWMRRVDTVAFVADNCTEDFCRAMPEFADKAVTILNITDSVTLKKRAAHEPLDDGAYIRMKNADCFKLVTVCRSSIYHKGLDRAVWCASKLKEKGILFLWTLVGDGPDFETVQAMIREHGLDEEMVMIGNRFNPLPFIKIADVFCMPSRYEGKPMVITESMILGTPPFVTRYLSAAEQIEHGIDGIIAENEDDAMFAALSECIDHPEVIRAMKEHLLTHEYGNRSYMRELEEKYLSIGDKDE